jgi:hypothetical protein
VYGGQQFGTFQINDIVRFSPYDDWGGRFNSFATYKVINIVPAPPVPSSPPNSQALVIACSESSSSSSSSSLVCSTQYSNISISKNGKYQILTRNAPCSQPASCFGELLLSSDYGNNWFISNKLKPFPESQNIKSIAINMDGQYISAVSNNYIFTSNDYGANWAFRTNFVNINPEFSDISMSYDGRIQCACGANKAYISTDYGQTWSGNLNPNSDNFGVFADKIDVSSDGNFIIGISVFFNRVVLSRNSGISWETLYSSSTPQNGISWNSNIDITYKNLFYSFLIEDKIYNQNINNTISSQNLFSNAPSELKGWPFAYKINSSYGFEVVGIKNFGLPTFGILFDNYISTKPPQWLKFTGIQSLVELDISSTGTYITAVGPCGVAISNNKGATFKYIDSNSFWPDLSANSMRPTNITVTNITNNSFNVRWDGLAATHYYVDISTGINFTNLINNYNNRYVESLNARSGILNVTGLSSNTNYCIRIAGVSFARSGIYSEPTCISTIA